MNCTLLLQYGEEYYHPNMQIQEQIVNNFNQCLLFIDKAYFI